MTEETRARYERKAQEVLRFLYRQYHYTALESGISDVDWLDEEEWVYPFYVTPMDPGLEDCYGVCDIGSDASAEELAKFLDDQMQERL